MIFGQTVPKGYLVAIQSSENDGDYTNTISHNGLTKLEADVLIALFPLFKSRNRKRTQFGNTESHDFCMDDLLELAKEKMQDLNKNDVDNFIGCAIMNTDFNECSEKEYDEIGESLIDFVKDKMLGYSDFYLFRYVDKIDVYYLPNDVIIPSVEKVISLS